MKPPYWRWGWRGGFSNFLKNDDSLKNFDINGIDDINDNMRRTVTDFVAEKMKEKMKNQYINSLTNRDHS